MNERDGGPAFPTELHSSGMIGGMMGMTREQYAGLSVRDYFAGQALALVLSQDASRIAGKLAENAYEIADAMIAQRAK